jgi:hypothetical protein
MGLRANNKLHCIRVAHTVILLAGLSQANATDVTDTQKHERHATIIILR